MSRMVYLVRKLATPFHKIYLGFAKKIAANIRASLPADHNLDSEDDFIEFYLKVMLRKIVTKERSRMSSLLTMRIRSPNVFSRSQG